jgi:hypothetical protein
LAALTNEARRIGYCLGPLTELFSSCPVGRL